MSYLDLVAVAVELPTFVRAQVRRGDSGHIVITIEVATVENALATATVVDDTPTTIEVEPLDPSAGRADRDQPSAAVLPYTCPFCAKAIRTHSGLGRHVAIVHRGKDDDAEWTGAALADWITSLPDDERRRVEKLVREYASVLVASLRELDDAFVSHYRDTLALGFANLLGYFAAELSGVELG